MKKLIAGNWKMNGTRDSVNQLVYDLMTGLPSEPQEGYEILLCPPFVYLDRLDKFFRATPVSIGAQDCASREDGAYTGDVSAAMIKDMGGSYVILGHSERRQHHGETDEAVAAKAALAHKSELVTIICVGEREAERAQGKQESVVKAQLEKSLPPSAHTQNTIIAYEPVWAIGTGKTATPQDVTAMHKFIFDTLKNQISDSRPWRILYGGSMKPDNAAALLACPHVDGGLIGGASLNAADFIAIAKAAP